MVLLRPACLSRPIACARYVCTTDTHPLHAPSVECREASVHVVAARLLRWIATEHVARLEWQQDPSSLRRVALHGRRGAAECATTISAATARATHNVLRGEQLTTRATRIQQVSHSMAPILASRLAREWSHRVRRVLHCSNDLFKIRNPLLFDNPARVRRRSSCVVAAVCEPFRALDRLDGSEEDGGVCTYVYVCAHRLSLHAPWLNVDALVPSISLSGAEYHALSQEDCDALALD